MSRSCAAKPLYTCSGDSIGRLQIQYNLTSYNLWREGDGDQRLELVVRDFFDAFREIMQSSEWRDHFNLTFQPIFNAAGGRLVGQPSSSLRWERIQKNLQPDVGQTLLSV